MSKPNFLIELRRRHVWRVAIAYAVVAWLLLQLAAIVLPTFGAPHWVLKVLIGVFVLFFPVAILLAWAFEVTPEGVRRTESADSEEAQPVKVRRRVGRTLNIVIMVVLVAAVGLLAWQLSTKSQPRAVVTAVPAKSATAIAAATAIPAKSIAVLPFVDMSQAHNQAYFADGLSDELLNMLARLPQLRVIARTSSFAFKGKDVGIATIAKALHVANILEGSVRKDGNTLRITARLVRASDSTQLWSQTYDRQLTDVFKVQDDIAAAVVDALKVKLLPHQQIANPYRSSNTEAYSQYLLGTEFYNRQNPDAWAKAIRAFHKAIALDPGYAAAYVGLAAAEGSLGDATGSASLKVQTMADAQKAIDLAPDLADGFVVRGARRLNDRDWAGARSDLSKAIALNPASSGAQWAYSRLMLTLGRLPEAIAALRKSVELNPLSGGAWAALGRGLNADGKFAAARQALERALEISPGSDYAHFHLGCNRLLQDRAQQALVVFRKSGSYYDLAGISMAEYSLGRTHESQQALDELIAKDAGAAAYQIAEAYAWRGDKDKAFHWLDRAYDQNDAGLTSIKADPLLKPIQNDPRYATLLKKMGLPYTPADAAITP